MMKVTVREYAEIIGKSQATVRHAILDGKIKASKPHGRIYIDSNTPWYTSPDRSKNSWKHGLSGHPLRNTWSHMKQRCYNPKNPSYHCYGGRGIKVCDEWRNDFLTFYTWAMENGYRDGLTIDRIDNDGDYTPSNCQFLTRSENSSKEYRDREVQMALEREQELAILQEKALKVQWYAFKGIVPDENKKYSTISATKRIDAYYMDYLVNGFTDGACDYLRYEMKYCKYRFPDEPVKIETPDLEYIRHYLDTFSCLFF